MKKIQRILAIPASLLLALLLLGSAGARAAAPGDMLVPVGSAVGIELRCQGVLVSGLATVETPEGECSPAAEAGVCPGDRITRLGERDIRCGSDFLSAAAALDGSPVVLAGERGSAAFACTVTPVMGARGLWQLGLWLREGVTGIGTVTYWDPATGDFGALGHGVCVPESGALLTIAGGSISRADVSGVIMGAKNAPGELQGVPVLSGVLGSVSVNSPCGIFGNSALPLTALRALPAADEDEIALGPASILSTVDAGGPREFDVEITRVSRGGDDLRQLTLCVTDPALLAVTGGIVQGMSGSPILQNGKLVGAVTHVLVNDPTKGYGISIENMLAAEQAA